MADAGGILAFDTLTDRPGIEIIDRLEQLRYQLQTPTEVTPEPVPSDSFFFPVGMGVSIETDAVTLPNPASVIVRDPDGDMVAEIEHLDSQRLPEGSYILDLSTQIKTYMEVTGPVEITAEIMSIQFEFTEQTTVNIGFRSRHTRPAATIETTGKPRDLMRAVSAFGSALKSTSPERSFPTLRGHPPRLELGHTLEVPSQLNPPETGIEIAIPPERQYVYPVVSLAYYLGARVVPAGQPQIRTDEGFVWRLDPTAFESQAERILKQVFLLDCLVRTEGFYNVSLHERQSLESELDLDWEALYHQSIGRRLESYLEVPFDPISEFVPTWPLVAHAAPSPETAEQLPFVVDDLAIVRTTDNPTTVEPTIGTGQTTESARSNALRRSSAVPSTYRSHDTEDAPTDQPYIQFEPTDSLEQGWIGDGVPIGANKLLVEAFENRLDREAGTGDISITIVLNDTRMDQERDLVDAAYGDRSDLPFDVSVHRDLSVEQLRTTLREECDFLHYIGHAEQDGFECPDGKLDAGTLDRTGVDAFLLNACSSYHQGIKLIEAGAIGGIVTLADIISNEAVSIGELIAKLLNTGFPLGAALSIASEESILGGQYTVVGDGGLTVTQPSSRTPNLVQIQSDNQAYAIDISLFPADSSGFGTIYAPLIESLDSLYFLASGNTGEIQVSKQELCEFLDLEDVPVRIDGEFTWSSTVSAEDL
ncbi:hypothetical protein GRX03_09930 [Halovenus sp. WSH3]|uniref:CHAT domain-containing protein n=1 Tax=Halovenus carboxidivorans TaxID=2692199 RepID=A0A6B0T144_9EURY|nr:hypothetical protein [Halovenus carboxidivorans]MXR51918.1 hypothetical protein [Halovenus carboxidivorans]